MKVFDLFERAYLINLDRDVDRLSKAQARLDAAGIPFSRFPALKFEGPVNETHDRKRGVFGCALSHRAILQAAWDDGLRNVLIFEDDVVLAADVESRIRESARQLSRVGWDIFYFGAMIDRSGPQLSENLWMAAAAHHAHAYAVSRRAMPRCIAWIDRVLREQTEFFDSYQINALKVYHRPLLAVQDPGYSYTREAFIDRVQEYIGCYDIPDFISRCPELAERSSPAVRRWSAEGRSALECLVAEELIAGCYDYHRVGYDRRRMKFDQTGRIGEGSAGCELFWDLTNSDGEVTLEIYSATQLTFSVIKRRDGVWHGRWEIAEKMPVEMTRLT